MELDDRVCSESRISGGLGLDDNQVGYREEDEDDHEPVEGDPPRARVPATEGAPRARWADPGSGDGEAERAHRARNVRQRRTPSSSAPVRVQIGVPRAANRSRPASGAAVSGAG